jgi:hypothetical protein
MRTPIADGEHPAVGIDDGDWCAIDVEGDHVARPHRADFTDLH